MRCKFLTLLVHGEFSGVLGADRPRVQCQVPGGCKCFLQGRVPVIASKERLCSEDRASFLRRGKVIENLEHFLFRKR